MLTEQSIKGACEISQECVVPELSESSEWELVDDHGFIYKLRKRKAFPRAHAGLNGLDPVLPRHGKPSDRAAFSSRKILTNRATSSRWNSLAKLLARKKQYSAEIAEWERLINQQGADLPIASPLGSPICPENSISRSEGFEVEVMKDDVLAMRVEAYEAYIEELENLRDIGENLCRQLEVSAERDKKRQERDIGENLCRQLEVSAERDKKRQEHDLWKEIKEFTPRTIIQSLTTHPAAPLCDGDLPARVFLGQSIPEES